MTDAIRNTLVLSLLLAACGAPSQRDRAQADPTTSAGDTDLAPITTNGWVSPPAPESEQETFTPPEETEDLTCGSLDWLHAFGTPSEENARDVVIAPDGGIIVVGHFGYAITLGEGEANETVLSNVCGRFDLFIAKYNTDGTLAWARQDGGCGQDSADKVAVHSDGSITIAGTFRETAIFGAGEPNEVAVAAVNYANIFVARYAADGQFLWVSHTAGASNEEVNDLAIGADGSAHVVGAFTGNMVFGPGSPNEVLLDGQEMWRHDGFVAKYDPDGGFRWVVHIENDDLEYGTHALEGVTATADGQVVVSGSTSGGVILGEGAPNEAPVEGGLFQAAYTNAGMFAWARSLHYGATGKVLRDPDGPGFLAVTEFPDDVVLAPGTPQEQQLIHEPYSGARPQYYIASHGADGALAWAVDALTGPGGASVIDFARGANGEVAVGGSVKYEEVTFGAGTGRELTLPVEDNLEPFVAVHGPRGAFRCAWNAIGPGTDRGHGAAIDHEGGVILVGEFEDRLTFSAGTPDEITLVGVQQSEDMFIARYAVDGTPP